MTTTTSAGHRKRRIDWYVPVAFFLAGCIAAVFSAWWGPVIGVAWISVFTVTFLFVDGYAKQSRGTRTLRIGETQQ